MSNPISEEQNTQQPGGAVDKVRKAARQLAYDVRYKVKGQFKDGQKSDAASLKRAYMQQLGKSPAPGPVKVMAKKMLVGEAYDLIDVSDTVNESVVNALLKVFAKKTQLEDADGNVAYEVTDIVQEEMKDTKYKVRVTDKSTGKTYVRMADREKIGQLRADPKISSVEMTGYGDSYDKPVGKGKEEGEKKKVFRQNFNYRMGLEDCSIGQFIGNGGEVINEFKKKIEEELKVEKAFIKILNWKPEMLEMYRAIGFDEAYGSLEYFLFKVSFLGGEKSDILKVEKMLINFVNETVGDNNDSDDSDNDDDDSDNDDNDDPEDID